MALMENLFVKPFKILVVESDRRLYKRLAVCFSESGFDYRIYSGINNIVPLVLDFQPDLVLLEYLSPVVNGGELCIQIKENTLTEHIPVVIYSSFPHQILSLGAYGHDCFIAKPFELTELMRRIDIFLMRYSSDKKKTENPLVSYGCN
jgi:DNA-binding response OmpR family regulator